ncbi:MAG TPA: hypothetical protein VNN79_02705, partial [Actinomycetota bacterium]|nr:hypothetical protein [Actinomycetota bacterium]
KSDGQLDLHFGGGDGIVTTGFGSCSEAGGISSDEDFAVARLLSSGTPDTGFSSDGKATVSFSPAFDECLGVAIDSGKIVLGGADDVSATRDVALARLTSGGHLDTSFGAGGKFIVSLSNGFDSATGVAVDGSGLIVASAAKDELGWGRFAVLRFTGNGQLDQSFGNSGITATKINGYAAPNGLALGNGTVVLAGETQAGGTTSFAAARYLT